VPPGNYRIEASKAGFKTVIKPDVILHVQDVVTINFDMVLGSAAESVTVEGGTPLINTSDASVSTVVDRQFAENLPLNGRSFQTLIQLTPGVVLTANNGADSGQFSVNGQRASSNYWMVDGVSANIGVNAFQSNGNGIAGAQGGSSIFGGTNSLVSVDALQEFRIQTSTFAPEFGRTPGAQISILTRSGTNQFHGTVFDYLRNDIFDANNWFNTSVTPALPKAKERQNDFGGTFSGPIHKDRTFFFFSYEGLRLRLPQTELTSVPDLAARQNAVSVMQPFLNAYPLPNGPEDPEVPGTAQFNASFSDPGTLDAVSLRMDHKFSDKLNFFARYNFSPSELDQRGFSVNALSIVEPARTSTQTATAALTWSVSRSIVNDFRFNYSSTDSKSYLYSDSFGGATPLTSLPFPNGLSASNSQIVLQLASLGLNSGQSVGAGKNGHNTLQQINIVNTLAAQKGSHALKLGVDFRHISQSYGDFEYFQDGYFLSVPDAVADNPYATILNSSSSGTLLFRNLGFFVQDTWRVFPRLTLTYGLRWDVDVAPASITGPNYNAVTGFNLSDLSTLALAPAGTAPFQTKYGNVAPRVGIAYQISQTQGSETVLRAGFGTFYDLATTEAGNILPVITYPFGGEQVIFGGTFPSAAPPPPITPPAAGAGAIFAFDPHLQLPYTLQWNVALERSLGHRQTITASYIGAAGRRLIQTAYISAPNPNYASAEIVANAGKSSYNALQLQFQRHLSQHLQALSSYTWAHSIDTASSSSLGNSSNALTAFDPNVNRGSSDFDVRNAATVGLTYDLWSPWNNSVAKTALRGWAAENIFIAQTAPPINVYYSGYGELSGGFLSSVRPNIVPGEAFYLYGPEYPGGKALNPVAFAAPPLNSETGLPTAQGNLPRNVLRGFGSYQWDFAIHRDFPIRELFTLQFRAEMFNVLNHPNFGQPIGDLSLPGALNPQFGKSTQMLGQYLSGGAVGSGAFDPLYQIGGPRSIQLALKILF
jgi:outer membrane receptor protein involved in Fe transport